MIRACALGVGCHSPAAAPDGHRRLVSWAAPSGWGLSAGIGRLEVGSPDLHALVSELAVSALQRMEQRRITSLPVLGDDDRVVGVIHLHDLWRTQMF